TLRPLDPQRAAEGRLRNTAWPLTAKPQHSPGPEAGTSRAAGHRVASPGRRVGPGLPYPPCSTWRTSSQIGLLAPRRLSGPPPSGSSHRQDLASGRRRAWAAEPGSPGRERRDVDRRGWTIARLTAGGTGARGAGAASTGVARLRRLGRVTRLFRRRR